MLKGSDTTVAPAEIAREVKRCVNQSFASIEDGRWGRKKKRGGEGWKRMKGWFLLQMVGLKNCYIFYVSIENCLFSVGMWELSVSCAVKVRNWMFRFCFNLFNVNLNFSTDRIMIERVRFEFQFQVHLLKWKFWNFKEINTSLVVCSLFSLIIFLQNVRKINKKNKVGELRLIKVKSVISAQFLKFFYYT